MDAAFSERNRHESDRSRNRSGDAILFQGKKHGQFHVQKSRRVPMAFVSLRMDGEQFLGTSTVMNAVRHVGFGTPRAASQRVGLLLS